MIDIMDALCSFKKNKTSGLWFKNTCGEKKHTILHTTIDTKNIAYKIKSLIDKIVKKKKKITTKIRNSAHKIRFWIV